MDGYNHLTSILRPHKELRGFYFGTKSILNRMCSPTNEDTAYSHLNELKVSRQGNQVAVEFTPFKKLAFSRIIYQADLRSAMLDPLCTPRKNGEEELHGYFDKKCFCPIVFTFEDIIKFITTRENHFEPVEAKCTSHPDSKITGEMLRSGNINIAVYKFSCPDKSGKELISEQIEFRLNLL